MLDARVLLIIFVKNFNCGPLPGTIGVAFASNYSAFFPNCVAASDVRDVEKNVTVKIPF